MTQPSDYSSSFLLFHLDGYLSIFMDLLDNRSVESISWCLKDEKPEDKGQSRSTNMDAVGRRVSVIPLRV